MGGRRWIATLIGLSTGLLLAFPAILFAAMSAGAGHGDHILARMLFPLPLLVGIAGGTMATLSLGLGLAQVPLYGALVGWAVSAFD